MQHLQCILMLTVNHQEWIFLPVMFFSTQNVLEFRIFLVHSFELGVFNLHSPIHPSSCGLTLKEIKMLESENSAFQSYWPHFKCSITTLSLGISSGQCCSQRKKLTLIFYLCFWHWITFSISNKTVGSHLTFIINFNVGVGQMLLFESEMSPNTIMFCRLVLQLKAFL